MPKTLDSFELEHIANRGDNIINLALMINEIISRLQTKEELCIYTAKADFSYIDTLIDCIIDKVTANNEELQRGV